MKKIIYLSSNDGSDMRINKELVTLVNNCEVIFLGIGKRSDILLTHERLTTYFVHGSRKSIWTYFLLFILLFKLLIKFRISSIHIINEQLMVIFWPLLFSKFVVLDLFDSIFLLWNMPGNKRIILKYLVYAPVNKIIVTDENRYNLMPDYLKKRTVILPNYPNVIDDLPNKKLSQELRIMYYGWLGLGRGTEIVKGLLATNLNIRIIMAGWFIDDDTRNLLVDYSDKVEYLGVKKQDDAIKIAAESSDFILCVYAPKNQNNVNASPNKVYDGILINTPVIMNREVKMSDWVEKNGFGLVIDSYLVNDFGKLYSELLKYKDSYSYNSESAKKYSWDAVQHLLSNAHQLTS